MYFMNAGVSFSFLFFFVGEVLCLFFFVMHTVNEFFCQE